MTASLSNRLSNYISSITIPSFSSISNLTGAPRSIILPAIAAIALCTKLYWGGRTSSMQQKQVEKQKSTTTVLQKAWNLAKKILPFVALAYVGHKIHTNYCIEQQRGRNWTTKQTLTKAWNVTMYDLAAGAIDTASAMARHPKVQRVLNTFSK